MANSLSGYWPDENCDDCGKKGVSFKHWGPLVPSGKEIGKFCKECWKTKMDNRNSKDPVRHVA